MNCQEPSSQSSSARSLIHESRRSSASTCCSSSAASPPSRERAQALLLAGQVRVNGARDGKAGHPSSGRCANRNQPEKQLRYSSRGGLKLEGALEDFGVSRREDKICLDIGSSTGGFTDCLLQNGARKVYAVDVTIDQLDWKLRQRSARDHDRSKCALSSARVIWPKRPNSSPWMSPSFRVSKDSSRDRADRSRAAPIF